MLPPNLPQPAPGPPADGEEDFRPFGHISRGGFNERIIAAGKLKEEGNQLLNNGDYEDALKKYVEGLYHMEWHPRARAMVTLPQSDLDQENGIKIPLLLNSVLCDLKMNPEEQVARLATSERRIAEVPALQPDNHKALFRKAQLLGRAGDYSEARRLLERLCRQQPNERAFRTELSSIAARSKKEKAQQGAFWKQSLDRLQSENASTAADVEGGAGAAGQVSGEEDYENFFVFLLQSFLTLWFWVVSRLRATALLVGLRLGLTNARASPE